MEDLAGQRTLDRRRVGGQWHGSLDARVPHHGGEVPIRGTLRAFPPVAGLAERMAAGSQFVLRVVPGGGHMMTWTEYRQATG